MSGHADHDVTISEGEDTYGAEHLYTFRFIQSSYIIYLHTTRSKTTTFDQRTSTLRMHSYRVRLYVSKTDNIKWSLSLSHTYTHTSSSSVKCGPSISNVLRLKKVTLVEMTGVGDAQDPGESNRVDEDPFEK